MNAHVTPAAIRRGSPDVTVAAVTMQGFVVNPGQALVIVHSARYTSLYTPTEWQGCHYTCQSTGATVTVFPGFSKVHSRRKAEHWVMGWCLTHAHDISNYPVRA
jgi:hypothetical protein